MRAGLLAQHFTNQKTIELQAEKAKTASYIWRKAKPCESHPYLTKKDVLAHGLRVDDKGSLIVPMVHRGRITSLQFINADGEKKMMYGAKKSGSYYRIGDETDCILICEGWATGATLHGATQLCVYIAFDSGLLS